MIVTREKKMRIVHRSEKSVVIDVDETLVSSYPTKSKSKSLIVVNNPYQLGQKLKRYPKWGNINLLRDFKGRGYVITVWSHGGAYYAYNILQMLELDNYVDFVMTKPVKFVDDKSDLNSIVGMPVFIND
jgi:predicted phosphatase